MQHRWSSLIAVAAAVMTVGFASCGDDGPESSNPTSEAASTEVTDVVSVG